METKRTNKPQLVKGLETMGLTLICLFLGPILLHAGLSNNDKPLHFPLVVIGFGVCGAAVYFGFKGINRIMNALFDKN